MFISTHSQCENPKPTPFRVFQLTFLFLRIDPADGKKSRKLSLVSNRVKRLKDINPFQRFRWWQPAGGGVFPDPVAFVVLLFGFVNWIFWGGVGLSWFGVGGSVGGGEVGSQRCFWVIFAPRNLGI